MPIIPASSQTINFPSSPALDPPSALDVAFQTFTKAMGTVDAREQLVKQQKHELQKTALAAGIADLDPTTGEVKPISFADRMKAKNQSNLLEQAKLLTDITKNQQEIAINEGTMSGLARRFPNLALPGISGMGFNLGLQQGQATVDDLSPTKNTGRPKPSVFESPRLFVERLNAAGLSAQEYAKHLKRNPQARKRLEEQVGGGHRADEFIQELLLLSGGV